MWTSRALDQIEEIHKQIAKGRYSGYRDTADAPHVALISESLARTRWPGADPIGFVLYWTAIAVAASFVGSSEIIYAYVVHEDGSSRRQTRRVVGQFLPSVAGGAAIAVCFGHLSAALVPLLPGLWAICFGIGTFASRLYLPRASGWIALYYYVAGFSLLWIARGPESLSGWWVGGTFGVGQLLAALVLWWNLERTDDA
jgi:uncharacterized membrane protein HdeD (DUF308 family)